MNINRLAQLIVALLIILPLGCAKTATQKASELRDDVVRHAERVDAAVATAGVHIDNADVAITAATTRPGNPAATQSDLVTAHGELGSARTALAPVQASTTAIKTDARQAADVTAHVDAQLQKVNASFFSPRQKAIAGKILLILAVLGVLLGALAYVSKTTGVSPILQVIGDAAAGVLRFIWSTIKTAATAVYHVGTLGLAHAGAKLGTEVAKRAAPPPVRVPPPASAPTTKQP